MSGGRENVDPEDRVRECLEGEGDGADGCLAKVLGPASENECLGEDLAGEDDRIDGEVGVWEGDAGRREISGAGAENVGVTNGDTGAG